MIQHILRRINLLFITLLILSIVSFMLAYLFPGDALVNLSGEQVVTPELIQKYAHDQPIAKQFVRYLGLIFTGDAGQSFTSKNALFDEVLRTLPATLELTLYALVLSILVGVPLGFIAGVYLRKWPDHIIRIGSVVGYSIPVFWLALILIIFLALQSSVLPISGRVSLLFDIPHKTGFILYDILTSDMPEKKSAFFNALLHMILPTVSISLITTTAIIRNLRRSIADVMEQKYISAAYGRGLTQTQVFWRHGFRNALYPILPVITMQFTILLTNAMIIELIFSWPGMGNWLLQSIYQRDYPSIRIGMLVVSSVVVVFTVVMDILIRIIHPGRIRTSYGSI